MLASNRGTGVPLKMRFTIKPTNKTANETSPEKGAPQIATDPILAQIYTALRTHPDALAAVEKILAQSETATTE